MRRWWRCLSDSLCGRCARQIRQDEPVLLIQLPNMKREMIRCQDCAGEAPPELPASTPRQSQQFTKRLQQLKQLPIVADWKTKAAGQ